MSSEDEEARRKIRELIREEVQAENRQETPSKKLGFYQKFHKYLVTQGEIPPTNRIPISFHPLVHYSCFALF